MAQTSFPIRTTNKKGKQRDISAEGRNRALGSSRDREQNH